MATGVEHHLQASLQISQPTYYPLQESLRMASQVVDKILGAAIVNKGFRGQSTGLSTKVRLIDLEHVITPQHASVYQLPFISQQQPNQVLPFRSGYKAPIQSRLGR